MYGFFLLFFFLFLVRMNYMSSFYSFVLHYVYYLLLAGEYWEDVITSKAMVNGRGQTEWVSVSNHELGSEGMKRY